MKTRLIHVLALALLALSLWLPQPAFADTPDRNANGEPIETATDSDLSDIPNLEKMDYETFQEYFGDVPGDHVPLLNPDNLKVQIKDKTPGSDKVITTEDLIQRDK
ncbi:MAG: hypothetical protein KME07_21265 [Pegethrix bostrychoides GSE-TBD4-15B]|jgi:hypothetical protein|uniref:Uncharacterized protein n=1 Tax=Pegethrix bostrychoides GSE-TBD4-15B TaxID=2839662 RepID=A0A951PEP3_9CYAN|nr:hypothetical protein [Pegethrix bostrychoides GSE-TBD4-15B]